MRGTVRGLVGVGLFAGLGAAAIACRSPTEVILDVESDFRCAELLGTSVTVGVVGEIEVKPPVVVSASCADVTESSAHIGSVVVIPSSGRETEFALKVVAGFGKPAENCVPPYGQGCIVARRTLRFVPHSPLHVTVMMRTACEGVPCDTTETCVRGKCTSAAIDPAVCAEPGACTEDNLAQ